LSYQNFGMKISALAQLGLSKKGGGTFRIHDDASDCLGVSYQAAWNWVNKGAAPKINTVRKVASAINRSFRVRSNIDEASLSDSTEISDFLRAVGATGNDAEDVELSMLVRRDERLPLDYFSFRDRARARAHLTRLSGTYEVSRTPENGRRSKTQLPLKLTVKTVISISNRHYLFSTLKIPSYDNKSEYDYDGVVYQRSGLLYWIFSQKEQELGDFLFMITSLFDTSDISNVATGQLITMGQSRLGPVAQQVKFRKMD
jgi:hypothetical protein